MAKDRSDYDSLVPDVQVMRELGITAMTIYRYSLDENLAFPKKVSIRGRNFRSRKALEEFKTRMMTAGIAKRKSPPFEASTTRKKTAKAPAKKAEASGDRRALES